MANGSLNQISLLCKDKIYYETICGHSFFPIGPMAQPVVYCVNPIPFLFLHFSPEFLSGNPIHENILKPDYFVLLSLSSVLIAAAGYIINDYFDLHIDRVNKPDKVVVEKIIKRRWAIIWHWVLSGLGIAIGFYLSWKLRNIFIGPSNTLCVLLLWFYSTTFKKIAARQCDDFSSHSLGNWCIVSLRIPASPVC